MSEGKFVEYYKKAFADGRNISPGNQQIQASYLIAELSRRIGDYDEAKQYFTSTYIPFTYLNPKKPDPRLSCFPLHPCPSSFSVYH